GALNDTASINADDTDNNKRFAGGLLDITVTNDAQINGVSYGSIQDFTGEFGSLTVGADSAELYTDAVLDFTAGSGNMILNNAAITSVQDMELTSTVGSISFVGGDGRGIKTTAGNLAITAENGFSNGGIITSEIGSLTARISGDLSDTGEIYAKTDIDIAKKAGGSPVNVTVGGSGLLKSETMNIDAASLSIADGGHVNTSGNIDLTLGSLVFAGSNSRIIAATSGGDATIKVGSAVNNLGAVHSGGNIDFTASSIANANTGGISALDTLTLKASSSALNNAGAIYAGSILNASAVGTFTNQANTGSINSDGNINLNAATFINQGEIKSKGSITITAPVFKNNIPDGDTREWYESAANRDQTVSSRDWFSFPDKYEATDKKSTWTMSQRYATSLPSVKPQIISGGALTIKGFNSGENIGGILSGSTVNMTGTGDFVINDLALNKKDYTRTWTYETKYIAQGPATYYKNKASNDNTNYIDSVISTAGAGIFGSSINASGFNLINAGATWETSVTTAGGAQSASPTSTSFSTTDSAAFPGLHITLPTNPNGYFVTSVASNAAYLIETNPLFKVGVDFVGSQYMEHRYGYDPDDTIKKLGDANYEAYLIRQQLISKIGSNLLGNFANEAAQMKGLMDSALAEADKMGLEYGKSPTKEQLAEIEEDMVWMVETEVDGQKVLAPVVYLAQSTKDSIATGIVIAANDINMDLASLSNTGGTISGDNTLNIKTKGDITNVSGTIKGGDVSVKSTEGSIINKTASEVSGGDFEKRTTIGKTAEIKSTKNLNIDAAKDITNIGANMEAGGDARLTAGGDVTFDTIEKKTATTTYSAKSDELTSSVSTRTEQTTEQIKSELTSGGNLNIKSGEDITLAATEVKAGGNANLDAAGDLNILARDNKKQVLTETHTQGLGVGGGVYGLQKETKDEYQSRNVGSNIQIGGDISMKSGNDLTIQGSELDIAGGAEIEAKDIQVIEGRDVDYVDTETETVTFLKLDKGGAEAEASAGASAEASAEFSAVGVGSASAGASAGAEASAKASSDGSRETSTGTSLEASADGFDKKTASNSLASGSVSASVSASAEAGYTANAGLKLMEVTKTSSQDYSSKSIGSKIKIGGGLKVKAKDDVLLRGADVEAKGDVDIDAKQVKVEAAQNIKTSKTKSEVTSVGIMVESSGGAKAEAKAGFSAEGEIGVSSGSAGVSVEAKAGAEANINTTVDVFKREKKETDTKDITYAGSAIKSGGKLNINAEDKLTVKGSELSGEQKVSLKAKDMEFLAVDEVHTSVTKTETARAGFYLDTAAEAEAKAGASANTAGEVSAEANVEAGAKQGVGIQVKYDKGMVAEGSTKAKVSSIKSGVGSIERTAENSITDVGTNIEAAQDFTQSAKTITSLAAKDTEYKVETAEEHTARIGGYGEAGAGAGTESGQPEASVSVGFELSYDMSKTSDSEASSKAVVSNIKAGGKVTSVSSEKTTLEGTNIKSGGDTEIEAGELDYKAAQDTEQKKSDSLEVGFSFGMGGGVGSNIADAEATIGANYAGGKSKEASSTAVAGGINSGGALKIKTTKGNVRLEGTNIHSAGDAEVDAAGDLIFDAATSTSSKKENSQNVDIGLAVGENEFALDAGGGYSKSNEKSVKQEAGSIASGGNLKLKSGKDMTLVGTDIAAEKDAQLQAAGDVDFKAAKSVSESSSQGFEMGISGGFARKTGGDSKGGDSGKSKAGSAEDGKGEEEEERSMGFSFGAEGSAAKSLEAKTGSIKSSGKLKISSGKNVTLEGTDVEAGGAAKIAAGGKVETKSVKSYSESSGFSAGFGVKKTETIKKDGSSDNKKTDIDGNKASLGDKDKKQTAASDKETALKEKKKKILNKTNKKLLSSEGVNEENEEEEDGDETEVSAGFGFVADSSSETKDTEIKAGGGIQIEENSAAAKAAASIQNPAVAQGAVSGAPVDMENFNAETKTEFAKQAMANALGIDPSEVDTSSPKFAELNKKLKEAKSINGTGPDSFDLEGFCKALKTD
ncbi:MAG: hemagglutinin repeat-containing protein, partial [Deltaproteobacteria bacterium]|nr:hemagglutinin repeat-containing protein [Deltaproteobacteria bacterium]